MEMKKSQRKWFVLLLTAVLVCLMAWSLPVWAEDVNETDEEKITGFVTIEGSGTDTDGKDISVYKENTVGILANATGKIEVKKGDIDSLFGAIIMTTSEGGNIDLTVGSISGGYDDPNEDEIDSSAAEDTVTSEGAESGFGIAASLDGGKITTNAVSIDAGGSFGLNVWADNSSTAGFTITTDSGSEDSAQKDAADSAEAEEEIISAGGGIFAAAEGVSLTADNGSMVTVETESIEAGSVGAKLLADNGGKIELSAEDISAADVALSIESRKGSSVTVESFDLSADERGLEVYAESGGTAEIKTQGGSLSGDLAAEVKNEGGTVELNTDGGVLSGVSGLSILSSSGTTTVSAGTLEVTNYGVLVSAVPQETAESAESAAAPEIKVTVAGDILGEIEIDPEEGGIEDPGEPDDPEALTANGTASKAADSSDEDDFDGWDEDITWVEDSEGDWTEADPDDDDGQWAGEWEEEETPSESLDSATGVIVEAEIEGSKVDVDVQGMINMPYGNDLYASDGSAVTLKVSEDVETLYGNRITAADSGTVEAAFRKDIKAGGQALDTLADSGTVKVNVTGNINASDAENGDPETAGIFADSAGSGQTTIKVGEGVAVKSTEAEFTAYGIDAENTGGTMTIEVNKNVSVIGVEAVGLEIINDPESSDYEEYEETESESEQKTVSKEGETIETTVTVKGNVTVTGSKEGTGAQVWNSGDLTLTVGTRDDSRDPDDKSVAGISAEGKSSTGMTIVSEGNSKIEVFGDVKGSDYGLKVDTDLNEEDDAEISSGKMDILVSETISGGTQSLLVNKDVTADQLDLTVWEIVLGKNKDAALTPEGNVNQSVEDSIKYIIRIDPDSVGKIKAVDENLEDLPTSHDYPYEVQGQRIYVQSADGSELTAVYNGKSPRRQTSLQKDENGFYLDVPKGGAVWLSVNQHSQSGPTEAPNSIDFYRIGDLSWLFDRQLPRTGFAASHVTALAARPQGLVYGSTGLTLQIPELGVAESILTVPNTDGEYPVEWLGSSIGLLEGSSLPGKGAAVLTGHNHLNNTEAGPFLSLGSLEDGARMMVTDARSNMQTYRVYGNYKIASDGFAGIADAVKENALVLITCEDESIDGGYLNRRVILAEPL